MTTNARMKVLVLGATGMLGHAVLRYFARRGSHAVVGTARTRSGAALLPPAVRDLVVYGVDVENFDSVVSTFAEFRPQAVINCVGLVKQLAAADDPLSALPINSLLPHRLARLCAACGARLVHVSTDCVFSGTTGGYLETDHPDAHDLYGRSKLLGEVDYPNAITLRTSIIGPELGSAHGLVGWFLAQQGEVRGYTKAIFSGLPTVELARVIHDFVLPDPSLRGVYHVSAAAVAKHALLQLIASEWDKHIVIAADERVVIDRSLDSRRFREATGYAPPSWHDLIRQMHEFG